MPRGKLARRGLVMADLHPLVKYHFSLHKQAFRDVSLSTLQPLTGESFPSVVPTQKRARIVSKSQNVRDSSQRSVSFDVITSSYVASSLDMLNTSDYCNQVYEQNSNH